MPIQDEKHEVVLFLCSHKDITKQKLHEQQQRVAAAAAAASAAHLHEQLAASTAESQQDGGQLALGGADLQPDGAAELLDKRAADEREQALLSMSEFKLDEAANSDGELDALRGDSDGNDDDDKHTASQYSRRRSRAVLYQLSGHYGYRRSVNMKSKLKLNNVSGRKRTLLAAGRTAFASAGT